MNNEFSSKILLFGEYSVILESMALAIPYPLFNGKLTFLEDQKPDSELQAYADYLKELVENKQLPISFDITSMMFDIASGLVFSSTIPQGHGVGSSGALVAAIFKRYGQNIPPQWSQTSRESESLLDLKKIFALMESHFHGKSSGIDPLISYLNHPLLLTTNKKIEIVNLPQFSQKSGSSVGGIFLINSKRPRRTEPLVNLFLEKCKEEHFRQLCHDKFIPLTNSSIHYFLEGQIEKLKISFNELSQFQYEHLSPMIPQMFKKVWSFGLNGGEYSLKLCGAGGGGLFLGMTSDFQKASEKLSPYQIRPVLFF
jgi:mevalonate kinase